MMKLMKLMDKQYDLCPAMGVRQMVDYLKREGYHVGKNLVRRLMALMGLRAVYPLKSLSKGGWIKYRMPYLLRGLRITHRNQVWSTDISYIPMENGFMYLYAIIDVYSRYIVGWGLYNTLDASNAIEVLDRAVAQFGAPEIINSDQGVQYTCDEWHRACDKYGIRISMDGRARCLDNVWIERFWRTIKREYVYLNPESTVGALRRGIAKYIDYYNNRRCLNHKRGIGRNEKNDYLSASNERPVCRALPLEGSAQHSQLTYEGLTPVQRKGNIIDDILGYFTKIRVLSDFAPSMSRDISLVNEFSVISYS